MEEGKNEKGFVIKDRRHFDESGAARSVDGKKDAPQQTGERVEQTSASRQGQGKSSTDDAPLPEMNFSGFIFSLSTTAMYHFGDFPDPVTNEAKRNLPAAKQTIDILSILKTKTDGNLDDDEKQLLDGILFELRMRFVKEMAH
jgi:hypothetical protein